MDRVLIISTDGDNESRIRQHKNAVAAAKAANVKFIAYTSVGNATNNTLDLAEVHRVTEKVIIESGINYSFLRNNWYLENEMGSIQGVLAGAPWLTSAEQGKVGWAAKQDYAEAAAAVIAGEGHENTIYELSGTPLTQEELVAIVETVINKKINLLQVDDAAYEVAMVQAGLPDFVVAMVVNIQKAIRQGALDIESKDLEKLLGRKPTAIADALKQML
jgi:NAD(P)H dehydrogenase (quinone)